MSTQTQDLHPQIEQAFTSLRAAVKACEDADHKQLQHGKDQINSRRSGWETITCNEKEAKKFEEDCLKIQGAMWNAFDALTKAYDDRLKQHRDVARKLAQVDTDAFTPVQQALQEIVQKISERMQQAHWKGNGADEYMKQLPTQLGAVTEFGQYVGVAQAGVNVPAQLQQGVFLAMQTLVSQQTQTINEYAQTGDGELNDRYFQRCAWAKSALDQAKTWFDQTLATGTNHWKTPLDSHIRNMTSTDVVNPVVLKGDTWPRATADTDVSQLPQPSQTPKVPTSVPGTDSLPTQGQPDVHQSGTGVDQSGYHEQDDSPKYDEDTVYYA